MEPVSKPELDDIVSDEDDGGLASEFDHVSDYEGEEDDVAADLLDTLEGAEDVAEEDADEFEEIEEEWEDDAAHDGIGDEDVPAPTRWKRQKKEKKARVYEGSPLRSEPDDDIV